MSYRGAGAWDGGPPGAEAEYATNRPPAIPATDPWTGNTYSQYPTASYDYRTYSTNYTTYGYDANYYRRPENSYHGKYPESGQYPSTQGDYNYMTKRTHSKSPERHVRKPDYRRSSRSRSPVYIKKEREYSRSRMKESVDDIRQRSSSRSRDRSRHYSSSDRSSSRSSSHSPSGKYKDKEYRSYSSDSSDSSSSRKKYRERSHSSTPRYKSKSRSVDKDDSPKTPEHKSARIEKERLKGKDIKSHSSKDKGSYADQDSKRKKINKRRSVTPEQSLTPPRAYKSKRNSHTPPRRFDKRDSSVTPPRSYMARRSSKSSSRESRNFRRSLSRSRSRSRRSSRSITPPPGQSKRKSKKNRSKSRSKSKGRSKSPRGKKKRRSSERSRSSRSRSWGSRRSRSRSGSRRTRTPSDDERRGQFTVADRKLFWKLHRSRQEGRAEKSPPKEPKPPPGAVEPGAVDDIQYGDPPEVEGPNFAELPLSASDDLTKASTSKGKVPLPIRNDGSFLEMFKKMQEITKKEEVSKQEIKKPILPFIGKRRGGRVLKTGLVKKAKAIDEQPAESPKDAWSLYMQEVKKYRETSCEEERKTRPLVK